MSARSGDFLNGLLFLTIPAIGAAQARTTVPDRLLATVAILAHDSLAGRGNGTPELMKAAGFVASQFRALGLEKAAGQGDYLVPYALVRTALDTSRVALTLDGRRYPLGRGVVHLDFNHWSLEHAKAQVVVLAGQVTDSVAFRAMSAARLGDKAVVITESADGNGILNVLMTAANPPIIIYASNQPDSVARRGDAALTATVLRSPADSLDRKMGFSHGIVQLPDSLVNRLLTEKGVALAAVYPPDGRSTATPVPGLVAELEMPRLIRSSAPAVNIVGLLRGSDPGLAGEAVVVSAHVDHLGVGLPDNRGDSTYNGADDNASGVAVLLEAARVLAAKPRALKRSVLFVVTTGEEIGMAGSEAFVATRMKLGRRIVADINVDGVGRPASGDSIAIVGMQSADWLGSLVAAVAIDGKSAGLIPHEDETIIPRGDHFSFRRRGIPSISFYSGKLNRYYHKPSDELSVIDPRWMARVSEFAIQTIVSAANHE